MMKRNRTQYTRLNVVALEPNHRFSRSVRSESLGAMCQVEISDKRHRYGVKRNECRLVNSGKVPKSRSVLTGFDCAQHAQEGKGTTLQVDSAAPDWKAEK